MPVTCPNINDPAWKTLETHPDIGRMEAMRDFMEFDTIRTPEQIIEKISNRDPEREPVMYERDIVPSNVLFWTGLSDELKRLYIKQVSSAIKAFGTKVGDSI